MDEAKWGASSAARQDTQPQPPGWSLMLVLHRRVPVGWRLVLHRWMAEQRGLLAGSVFNGDRERPLQVSCTPCGEALWLLLSGWCGALQEDGTMVLLDFGQCKALSAARQAALARLVIAMDQGWPAGIVRAMKVIRDLG